MVSLRNGRAGSEIFVYTRDQRFLFAAICTLLDRLGLSVVEAGRARPGAADRDADEADRERIGVPRGERST